MISKTALRLVALGACLSAAVLTPACSSEQADQTRTKAQNLTADSWTTGSSYQAGDLVEYEGKIYRAIQGHTSLNGWQPPNVPALWEFVGMDDGGAAPVTPDPVDELSLEYIAGRADCDANPEACCAPGSQINNLTAGDDTLYSVAADQCVIAQLGRDTVFLQSSGPSSLILGEGDDVAMDGAGDDLIWGGFGRDTINGYGGTNLFFGGWGDDVIMAANGTNTVVPGPGIDTVSLGTGDDTVHIFDLCEIEPGEQIDGGTGYNTLYTPVPLDELTALGVSVVNFQNIIVVEQPCLSQCSDRSGCGACFVDTDSDGASDCVDDCRVDPNKTAPGDCGCNKLDTDTDGDGYANCIDECPDDASAYRKGSCGCPTDPRPEGTVCFDSVCPGQNSCSADGECGDSESCSPIPGSCRLEYFSKYQRYYWFCDAAVSWDEARDLCGASGDRKLAFLGMEEINSFATGHVTGEMWMGANAKSEPGNWYWRNFAKDNGDLMWVGGEDGTSYFARYNNWSTKAPSESGACGYINESGKWTSESCATGHGFICEVHIQRVGFDCPPGEECEGTFGGPRHQRPAEITGIPAIPWRPDPATCVDDDFIDDEAATLGALAECEAACLEYGDSSDQCADACVGAALPPQSGSCDDEGILLRAGSRDECKDLVGNLPEEDREDASCIIDSCKGLGEVAPGNVSCTGSDECGAIPSSQQCLFLSAPGAGYPECDDGQICNGFFCSTPTVCSDQYAGATPGVRKCVIPPPPCEDEDDMPLLCESVDLCDPDLEAELEDVIEPTSDLSPEDLGPESFADPYEAPQNEAYPVEDNPCGGDCTGLDVVGDPLSKGQAHPWCHLGSEAADDLPDQPTAPQKDGGSNNGLVRFTFDPKFEFSHKAEIGAFGIPDIDVVAAAGIAAGAELTFAGNPHFTILDVSADLVGTECGIDGDATLNLLGMDFIDVVSDNTFEIPFAFPGEAEIDACNEMLEEFQEVANRAKKALRDAIELKRQYAEATADDVFDEVSGEWVDTLENNLGEDFCKFLGEQTPRGFPAGTCETNAFEDPEETINRAIQYYAGSVLGFATPGVEGIGETLGRLEELLAGEASKYAVNKNITFFEFERIFEETIIATQFFIGPIPCFLEVFATADFGVDVNAQLRLDPAQAVSHLFLKDETAPSPIAYAGIDGVPHAGAGIGIFAGVGFGIPGFKVQLGIRGDLSLGQIYVPAYVGAGIGVGSTPDLRDDNIPADMFDLADPDPAHMLIPPKKIVVDLSYQAGLSVNIRDILTGEISAQLKLKIAFFSKKWRKTLLRFSGLCGTDGDGDYESLKPMSGCDFPIFAAGGSLTGGIQPPIPWGEVRMPVTFPLVPQIADRHPVTAVGTNRAKLTRAEEFFYDSLCTCIDDAAEAEGKECFRNDDCCAEDEVCFDDLQSAAPNKCITCISEDNNCNEDSNCCSNLCVSGKCAETQCGSPCTRDEECWENATCSTSSANPGGPKICRLYDSESQPCSVVK